MKGKLTNNWQWKLVSLIFSFVLWMVVTNINDPVSQYKAANIPVKFIHTEVITSQGKVYEVLDDTDVLDQVIIMAPRSIIDVLSDQNVSAVADFNDLTIQNTITIKLSTDKYNDKLESIKGNFDEVKLKIENKKTISLALKPNITGEVNDGYLLGDVTTDRNLVKISGPESLVSEIVKAGVDISVTDFTSNISTDADIKLYNADGEEVNKDRITMNISTVKVNVEILETKRVPLSFSVTGSPADGYMISGDLISSVDTLLIAGRAEDLSSINRITIPEEAINVTGQTEEMMAIVNVADYLPSGVSLVNTSAGLVTVTVPIEQEQKKVVSVEASDIRIKNIPDGYEAKIVLDTDAYSEIFVGLREDLAAINIGSIAASVDLNDLEGEESGEIKDGTYELNVTYDIDQDKIRIEGGSRTVSVIIKVAG